MGLKIKIVLAAFIDCSLVLLVWLALAVMPEQGYRSLEILMETVRDFQDACFPRTTDGAVKIDIRIVHFF